nr:MAG TPA: hypothetical protein [Caudoviricetes sp.]
MTFFKKYPSITLSSASRSARPYHTIFPSIKQLQSCCFFRFFRL